MSCVNCARTIERSLSGADGIKSVQVSFELGRVKVEYDPSRISQEQIARIIEELGYRVVDEKSRREILLLGISALCSALIVFLILWGPPQSIYLQAVLSTIVQVLGGWKFYRGAYLSLRKGIAGMDVLVALGTTGAYLYSILVLSGLIGGEPFFETNALLITFVLGGRLIEEMAKKRALRLLSDLLSVHRAEVTVLRNGREERVNVREVFRGERILCRTGDMVPLDGVVEKGRAWVSEAVVSGEPEPVLKRAGDPILSGSLVEDGLIEVKVSEGFEGSYLTRISRTIESALEDKPKIQRVVDRVSHYFVQFVVIFAVGVFLYWFLSGGGLQQATMFSLAVLVVSCPCALGIATPLAVVMGVSLAISRGILIKRPASVELFSKVDTIVFDKTGTVTEGKFKVVAAELYEPSSLDVAYTLEKRSNHPIAKAIREYAEERGAKDLGFEDCREIIGFGVRCGEFFIGSTDEGLKEKVVLLKRGEEVIARFVVSDKISPHAKGVVKSVKKLGLRTVLLSGDREDQVRKVAFELGFDDYAAEVDPDQKLEYIRKLQREGRIVAMVGDGVNDAPAMAQADLSFAVSVGTDITKHVGDILLLGGIKNLPEAFILGRAVRRKILQNLGWAFVYNLIGIPVAGGLFYGMGIYLRPELAGLMMALSSVSVVLNTLLLRYNIPSPIAESEEKIAQSSGHRSHSGERAGVT
jgi:Cu2+-exporting ATPase/Cu+-exporting ATPase